MNRPTICPFVATLSYYLTGSGSFSRLHCRGCRESLDIHQPDPNRPDQFLGTCPGCGRWYRVGPSAKGDGLVVLHLPEVEQVKLIQPPAKDATA